MELIDTENVIEQQYCISVSEAHRKELAQFFTPLRIAEFLADYILKSKREVKQIIEPAFGLGIFSRVLRSEFKYQNKIKAFEIDEVIIKYGNDLPNEYSIDLVKSDYLNEWNLTPDCIICNPPYLKFHDYDNLTAVKKINGKLNINLNGFTNIYALFLLKSLSELPINGRAAYIVPSEFFNADYGVAVKRELIKTKMLKHVINFHFEENVFEGAITTSTLLLLENSNSNEYVQFYNITTTSELERIGEVINGNQNIDEISHRFIYKFETLDPSIKWRNYYQETKVYRSDKLVNLKNYCRVSRGIATGANDYFAFNKSKAKEYGIKNENLINCITKSTDITKLFFSQQDLNELIQIDKKVFLVDLRILPDDNTSQYVKLGETLGINQKFLTKNRSPWYALENKKAADIWVAVFNRERIKFIQNNSNALNLTTFHGIYINSAYIHLKDIIFLYLLTDLAKEIFDSNRREYGNGLSKYEPNDFNNCDVFNFNMLTSKDISQLNEIIEDLKARLEDPVETNANITRADEYFRELL